LFCTLENGYGKSSQGKYVSGDTAFDNQRSTCRCQHVESTISFVQDVPEIG
jgi:hypothetical protein